MSALDEAGVVRSGRSGAPWAPLVHDWLPIWLSATGFEVAATEVREATTQRAAELVDELFATMTEEVGAAIEAWIDPDDPICEPMAVLESSEYVLGSLPAAWLEFVRSGRFAGRAALVAQMALFATLVRLAADPLAGPGSARTLAEAGDAALAALR